ncbi:MAG: response regulator [Saprospiraceae bacterium]
MIKIILADDHKMFIDGLRAFLKSEEDISIVGEASNGEEVIAILEKTPVVDIVVMDIEMPEMNGIEATKQIKKHFPGVSVLVLSMSARRDFILNLMDLGISGYILKNKSKEELIGAIRNIKEGKPHFGLEILDQIPRTLTTETNKEAKLTDSELKVLRLVAEGMTTKEIAEKLILSGATIDVHKRNLLHKIGVPNDKFLVRYAIKHGIVTL